MDLTLVKNFLRIDIDDDDEYLMLLTEAARDYVTAAVGECNESKPRVKLLMLNIIASLYETRQFTIDKTNEKVQYALNTMITQLQLETESGDTIA
jgi:uncharacterized phage protein (predicted DNA packaging)